MGPLAPFSLNFLRRIASECGWSARSGEKLVFFRASLALFNFDFSLYDCSLCYTFSASQFVQIISDTPFDWGALVDDQPKRKMPAPGSLYRDGSSSKQDQGASQAASTPKSGKKISTVHLIEDAARMLKKGQSRRSVEDWLMDQGIPEEKAVKLAGEAWQRSQRLDSMQTRSASNGGETFDWMMALGVTLASIGLMFTALTLLSAPPDQRFARTRPFSSFLIIGGSLIGRSIGTRNRNKR